MKRLFITITGIFISLSLVSAPAMAQQIPPGQDVGAVGRETERTKRDREIREKLIKGREKPEIREDTEIMPEKPETLREPSEKIYIEKIVVEGVTAISPLRIRVIIAPYEGRELSMEDFRAVSDAITDEYRMEGYVTSVAYPPPQRIENNTLLINVAEGRVGDITLEGNKHFKKKLLMKYITLKKDDIFNYDTLRSGLSDINVHPDREAKALLSRGEERGQTDVDIQVQDRLPIHATLGYDNYNSRYLDRNRYLMELKSTNLLGFDDMGSVEVQLGEAGKYQLYSGRYLAPIIPKWKAGAYYIHVDQELGREVAELDIKGEGDIVATYLSYKAVDRENLTLHINPGFEYKDITNKILGITVGEDDIRIAKLGIDVDFIDRFEGRTVLTQEFDFGIEGFMGGLDYKDPTASRLSSGGRFFRTVTNIARIQSLPHSMSLMLRGAMQLSAYSLVSAEQFNIGGINTVRGYPKSEHAGDRGGTISVEVYVPPYFIPKDKKIPYTETTFFDAIRFVGFFDYGYVKNKNPQIGEVKDESIYSIGPAIRFYIPGRAEINLDYGFGLADKGSNGSRTRYYVETKLYF